MQHVRSHVRAHDRLLGILQIDGLEHVLQNLLLQPLRHVLASQPLLQVVVFCGAGAGAPVTRIFCAGRAALGCVACEPTAPHLSSVQGFRHNRPGIGARSGTARGGRPRVRSTPKPGRSACRCLPVGGRGASTSLPGPPPRPCAAARGARRAAAASPRPSNPGCGAPQAPALTDRPLRCAAGFFGVRALAVSRRRLPRPSDPRCVAPQAAPAPRTPSALRRRLPRSLTPRCVAPQASTAREPRPPRAAGRTRCARRWRRRVWRAGSGA